MFVRVEIGVTEFQTKTAEKEELFWGGLRFFFQKSKVGVRIPSPMGNFYFLAAEKLTLGGGLTSKLASQ